MRYFVMFLPSLVILGFLSAIIMASSGCCRDPLCDVPYGAGGGQDSVTAHLPFNADTISQCVQGAGGSYSHQYNSTAYDVDFDTPNTERIPLYAPADGVLYAHEDDRATGFGVHANLDIGDGTYIILAHMDDVFVDNGSEVAEGQLLGYEGTTGSSTGDHVHMGRHDGDAAQDGVYGTSIEGLALSVVELYDMTMRSNDAELTTSELVCDLTGGEFYTSRLDTPRWHPDGSLVKTPDTSTVYLLEDGARRAFWNEEAFWSRGYDFGDVALIDYRELECYDVGANITGTNDIVGVYDSGAVWLAFQGEGERQRVPSVGWQSVLKSWGIAASTYDDLATGDDVGLDALDERAGEAGFRDGSLVSEVSSSAVYVMSNGIAMPVASWEVYLLMGFEDRTVTEVDDGLVNAVMDRVGDCATNAYCVTRDDVVACGGPSAEEATYPEHEDEADDTSSDVGGVGDGTLSLAWTTPDGAAAERITLSGEYTRSGGRVESWRNIAETTNAATLTYALNDVVPGDSLRFSVEFVQSGATSWSCLAPYPPGTVQGTATASWNDTSLSVEAADDPSSDGCGLVVTVN